MISFPRSAARAFRAVAGRGVVGRNRGPEPPIALMPSEGAVVFAVNLPAVILYYRVPTDHPGEAPVLLSMESLESVAGGGSDLVTLEAKGSRKVVLRWTDRGQVRFKEVELLRQPMPKSPQEPVSLSAMPREFLEALHEAGRTTGCTTGRYALDRVQVKGRTGVVAASDGHTAYLHGGFRFPFKEDFLVPAVPLFGAAELHDETEISVGRTDTHVVVRIGPWTVWLALDLAGGFPDVAGVVPKVATAAAILDLDEADAAVLLAALPKLPGTKDHRRPVTLDLKAGQPAIVRARSGEDSQVAEVGLDRSTVTRGAVRVAVDRTFLDRAIRLGCRTLHVASAERPVVARKGPVLLLTGVLDPSLIVLPTAAAEPEPTSALVLSSVSASERCPPMEIAPLSGPSCALAPVEPSPAIDPLAEAEALRVVCVEAGQHLGRLVEWFQARRKQPRALARVWSALQSLKLRP